MAGDDSIKSGDGRQMSQFSADLVGEAEVPPLFSEGYGRAFFSFNNNEISYTIELHQIDKVAAAHLHNGTSVVNGDVLATLYTSDPSGNINGILKEGTITSAHLSNFLKGKSINDLWELMKKNQTYVNVHSTDFPDGEIRGTVISSQKTGQAEPIKETYAKCTDNGKIAPCIFDDGSIAYYCDDPRSAQDGTVCMPSPQEWAKLLPDCGAVNYAESCAGPQGPVFTCDDPEFDIRKYPHGCIGNGQEGTGTLTEGQELTDTSSLNGDGLSTLVINVMGATPQTGIMKIGTFGSTADQQNTKFDKDVTVDIGKLAEKHQSGEFEIVRFSFKIGEDVPLGGYIDACFDVTVEGLNDKHGGCNYVELDTKQSAYSITLDVTGFRQ